LAAIAPSGAAALKGEIDAAKSLPVIHVAGENDPLVKFEWQKLMIARVKKLNQCSDEGKAWHSTGRFTGTEFASTKGAPLVTLLHKGGHEFPIEAPPLIVNFFKEHPKP
jgi:polyhydroxybutyrate depolymerase